MRADRDFLFLRNGSDRDSEFHNTFPTGFSSTFAPVQYAKLQNVTPLRSQHPHHSVHHPVRRNSEESQTAICDFFAEIASSESPQQAIDDFKDLFILKSNQVGKQIEQSLYDLIVLNRREDFFMLLDRCCCILIKQWLVQKQEKYIVVLLNVFKNEKQSYKNIHPTRRKLKQWILGFSESQYFQSLQLFVKCDRHESEAKMEWKNRYTAYLLMAQSFNPDYPREHRDAAKLLAAKFNKKFKFKLALCLAHSNLPNSSQRVNHNPTRLNLRTLGLIQQILVKRKNMNYRGVANIFLKQTEGILYKDFKQSLLKYLLFSLKQSKTSAWLHASISNYLESLYPQYNDRVVDGNLRLRICKRLIAFLLKPDWETSSHPFTLLAKCGNYLTLATLLLKIILICPSSYKHLILCTVALIEEYETQPEAECQWIIGFLETLRVVLTIAHDNHLTIAHG